MAFLDTLIAKMQEEQLSLDSVQEEVDTFMFEVSSQSISSEWHVFNWLKGHDTTATALNFALFMLALHQDVQKRVCEEMQTIFGKSIRWVFSSKTLSLI